MSEPDDPAFEIACFHAQQSAEKYLKALLCSRGVKFPNTHDLARLGGLASESLSVAKEDLARLTPFAVSSRYPGVDIPETREDAEFAIGTAERVRKAVAALLEK